MNCYHVLAMTTNLTTMVHPTIHKRQAAVKGIKRRLKRAGISHWAVAQVAGVTDTFVWMVLAGRRTSPKVMSAIKQLLLEHDGH